MHADLGIRDMILKRFFSRSSEYHIKQKIDIRSVSREFLQVSLSSLLTHEPELTKCFILHAAIAN